MRLALRLLAFPALLLAASLAASGCPGPDWPKCENDDHCKEKDDVEVNYVCVFGQCQECGRDSDCSAGKKCKKNKCVAPCKDDRQCGKGTVCNRKTGDCIKGKKKSAKGGACVETGDCQSGLVCEQKKCMTEAEAEQARAAGGGSGSGAGGTPCVETGDCKEGFVCYEKKCLSEEEAEMAANAAAAAGGEICNDIRIFFAFNLFDLNPEAREILDGVSRCMLNNADKSITVEGHADERGTTQYNLDLGEKRARAVKDYLARLGVDRSRIRTVSYGEEKPLEPASNEDAWSLNRRGEIKFK